MDTADRCKPILRECLVRMESGARQYGDEDYKRKDCLFEIECELMDVVNYALMELLKLRDLRARRDAAVRETIEEPL